MENGLNRCRELESEGQCKNSCAAGYSCIPLGSNRPACAFLGCPSGYEEERLIGMCRKSSDSEAANQTYLLKNDAVFVPIGCLSWETTIYEFSKEQEPLNAKLRVIYPKSLGAAFELVPGSIFSLRIVRPIETKANILAEIIFIHDNSTHFYRLHVFVRP